MNYYTADSYRHMNRVGEPFEENGHMYTNVEATCDRCGGKGIFVVRVENGVGIPAQPDAGVCYKCGGKGFERKKVRLYTEKEYNRQVKAKEQRREKAAQVRAERVKAKQAGWASNNGFDDSGYTWLFVKGNTYAIKDFLKENGYKFNRELGWHGAQAIEDLPEEYEMEQVSFSDMYEFNAEYAATPEFIGEDKLKALRDKGCKGEFVGEVGERLRGLKVYWECERSFDGYYGRSYIYRFTYNGNVLVWMTSKYIDLDEEVDWFELTGTVKKHDTYNGEKQTYLSRCIIKEWNGKE